MEKFVFRQQWNPLSGELVWAGLELKDSVCVCVCVLSFTLTSDAFEPAGRIP